MAAKCAYVEKIGAVYYGRRRIPRACKGRLVDEQLLLPDAMTGADLVRRRALGNVGARIIREARNTLGLGEHLDALYRELVFFNHATVQGEADYESRSAEKKEAPEAEPRQFDLSGFDVVLEALGAPANQPSSVARSVPISQVDDAHPTWRGLTCGMTDRRNAERFWNTHAQKSGHGWWVCQLPSGKPSPNGSQGKVRAPRAARCL